jgi:hypothetical protein
MIELLENHDYNDDIGRVIKLVDLPPMESTGKIKCAKCNVIEKMHANINKAIVDIQKKFTHKLSNSQLATLGRIENLEGEVKELTRSMPEMAKEAAEQGSISALARMGIRTEYDAMSLHEFLRAHIEKKEEDAITKRTIKLWLIISAMAGISGLLVVGFWATVASKVAS